MLARNKRGYTLVETLVVAVLFLLLLGVFYQLLVPAFEVVQHASARRGMQQEATVVFERLGRELEAASATSVSHQGEVICFQQLVDYEPSRALQVWDDHLVAYLRQPADETVVRQEIAVSDVNKPAVLTPVELADLVLAADPTRRVLARGVTVFEINQPVTAYSTGFAQPLEIRLELQRVVSRPAPKTLTYELRRRFFLRNRAN